MKIYTLSSSCEKSFDSYTSFDYQEVYERMKNEYLIALERSGQLMANDGFHSLDTHHATISVFEGVVNWLITEQELTIPKESLLHCNTQTDFNLDFS